MVYYILVGIFFHQIYYTTKRLLSYPFEGGCSLFLARFFFSAKTKIFYVVTKSSLCNLCRLLCC